MARKSCCKQPVFEAYVDAINWAMSFKNKNEDDTAHNNNDAENKRFDVLGKNTNNNKPHYKLH